MDHEPHRMMREIEIVFGKMFSRLHLRRPRASWLTDELFGACAGFDVELVELLCIVHRWCPSYVFDRPRVDDVADTRLSDTFLYGGQ